MLKMLWTAENNKEWGEYYETHYDLIRGGANFASGIDAGLKGDELVEKLKGCELFVCGYDRVTKEVLENCPDLKVVMSVRDGPEENIDIETCTNLGIPVLFSGGRCLHAVAELSLALMFNLARPIIRTQTKIRNKDWKKIEFSFLKGSSELYRKTVSIIGYGRNGRELAKLCNGIGMNVVAYDPYVKPEDAAKENVKLLSLEDCLKEGDYVVLLARVTPETMNMIGKEQLALMKPTACLINTGRAKLTDEDAIIEALENGTIRAAAIDVYKTEPINDDNPYFRITDPDKLIMTPHIAGITDERDAHQYELLEAHLQNFFKGNKNITIKNPEVFDTEAFKNRGGLLFGKDCK